MKLVLPVALAATALAGCAPAPNIIVQGPDSRPSGLTVTGSALVRAVPTLVVIELGFENSLGRASEARGRTESTIKKVIAALKAQKISEGDIQTTSFSLGPWYDSDRKLTLWNCSSSLEVRIKDVNSASDVLDAALSAGANRVNRVEYTVEQLQELRAKARDEACAVAKKKAEQYAQNFGVKLRTIRSISETLPGGWSMYNTSANVNAQVAYSDRSGAVPGGSDAVLSAGSVSVNLTVNVTYDMG